MASDEQVIRVRIRSAKDLVTARQKGRDIATSLGFSLSQAAMISTAISELARNIVTYASTGEILLQADGEAGIIIVAKDRGPGILNVEAALQPGYSTAGGLGLGLAGVRRIADSMDIQSGPNGTTITLSKKRV